MNRLISTIVVTYFVVVSVMFGCMAVGAFQASGWGPGGLFALCAVVVALGGFAVWKEWKK